MAARKHDDEPRQMRVVDEYFTCDVCQGYYR